MTTPYPGSRRVVTSHNQDGKAIVHLDSVVEPVPSNHGPWVYTLWANDSFPAKVDVKDDPAPSVKSVTNNGSIIRMLDLPPKSNGILHRSISLDYIFVVKGTIVLTLDDGSRTTIDEGGLVVQQATMHGWDNETDEWTRLLCVLMIADTPEVGGKKLIAETGKLT